MKKFFVAIRQGNGVLVRELLEKKPQLIACTSTPPPKKDNGQSPLQIAIKSANPDIADYLLDLKADVNFMEDDAIDGWRAPVLHDAIRAVLDVFYYHKVKASDRNFLILKRLLVMGADVHKRDSVGADAWHRALWIANMVLRAMKNNLKAATADNHLPKRQSVADAQMELELAQKRVEEVLDLLIEYGADIYSKFSGEKGYSPVSGLSVYEYYILDLSPFKAELAQENPVADLLKKYYELGIEGGYCDESATGKTGCGL